LPFEEDLNATTFQAYLFLVKVGEPVGPRDLMRGVNLSSPAVAHRILQKLVDLGLAEKDAYARYAVKEKVGFKGYVWLGNSLFPRFMLNCFFLAGLLIVEVFVLSMRLLNRESIEPSYILLVAVTAFSTLSFLIEGLRLRNKMRE
jgi:ABC-type cobalamin transport system permease subunit